MSHTPPEVGKRLREAASRLAERDVAVPEVGGKLLRPAVAWAMVPEEAREGLDETFWNGALAIQMVHEASLLHDDILDGAETRRGVATVAAEAGVARALVLGDRYLTASYRAAAAGGSSEFLDAFITAVERTVAGEVAQGKGCGRVLSEAEYGEIIRGKSGELFGAAAVLAATRCGGGLAAARDVGCAVGSLYQMVDDFLDYCPGAATGKDPFRDYAQRKYTFVLREAGIEGFNHPVAEVRRRLFHRTAGAASPMERALQRLVSARDLTVEACTDVFGCSRELAAILDHWLSVARRALDAEVSTSRVLAPSPPSGEAVVVAAARSVGSPGDWADYFGRHSKSFRFASLLFPAEPRADVEGVYAFCRFTDDLVDEADVGVDEARARLGVWEELSRAAYEGRTVEVPLLDHVMGRMREGDVPFHYAGDLIRGVGMDLDPPSYPTLAALEVYTYRVASVVGGWVTELFGLRDPALLSRAFSLGHAMQLTNILRDVGEDWRNDRLYLPEDVMARFGVTRDDVARVASTGSVDDRWIALIEDLMETADRHYAAAFEAVPLLPSFYRRPVAVAARVYRGIHDEIRANEYDNGTRRAYTTLRRKVGLGVAGLWELRKLPASPALGPGLNLIRQDT